MSRNAVLIFSNDPVAGALLGAAAELEECRPHFPHSGEPARDALLRIRPGLVLVDCDHDEACSDRFVGPAMMTGATVLLLTSHRTRSDGAAAARQLGVQLLRMPEDQDVLSRMLRDLTHL